MLMGIGSNYRYMEAFANHGRKKASAKDAGRKVTQQPVHLSISDEADMLRKMTNQILKPDRIILMQGS